ncbi:MAG: TIGR03560 family F420-dependent LLM class oxidoreductase [Nitrososphaerota archaeon]|nr:TIGR03560 family F420-dependent LLM class oxidoreductase [Nitrososphaerota archaeon]MDG6931354.1 TIGR03560 family F420-dependent LLM class oxidoreductase [Nitrososphaerota archaeon]
MVKFGIQHENYNLGADIVNGLKEVALQADNSTLDSFWVPDHLIQIPGSGAPSEPMLEGWVTISAISQITSRIKLGTLVSGNIYRNPALLAKMGATLDVLSGGRLLLGIGAGWFETEAIAYGIPFYDARTRLKRLEESVKIIRSMWDKGYSDISGEYYRTEKAFCFPMPIQKPHPPIIIGGSGDTTLRIVAGLADGCNLFNGSPAAVRAKLDKLKGYCEASGTKYDILIKSRLSRLVITKSPDEAKMYVKAPMDEQYNYPVYGTPEQVREKIQEYIDAGLDYLIFNFDARNEKRGLGLFINEVLPYF